MKEPRSKTYGDHWLTAQSGVKARLRGYASAYQEVATPDDRPAFADMNVGVRATQEQFTEFARFPLMFVPFMQYAG